MGAIAGAYRLDDYPTARAELGGLFAALVHRGADEVVLEAPSVAIGRRSGLAGPARTGGMALATRGTLALAADVRLDNRDEVAQALGRAPADPRGTEDESLLLDAYARWGLASLERFVGDFAFVIWDGERRELVCARDHYGVRPLYYHHLPGRLFAFASELTALLRLPGVDRSLEETEVARHLLAPVEDDPGATIYRAIRKVIPGHALRVTRAGTREHRYWQLDPDRSLVLSSGRAYAEAFRELFDEAVRCRVPADARFGSMLSGGLDSSAVTCMAARHLGRDQETRLHTYSAVFSNVPESDERPFMEAVLRNYAATPCFLHADRLSPREASRQVHRRLGYPSPAANLYLNWHLYDAAQAHGVHVVLDGFDGDTTVSHGTGYFSELIHTGRWLRLALEVRAFARANEEPWIPAYLAWIRRHPPAPLRLLGRGLGRQRVATTAVAAPLWKRLLSEELAGRVADRLTSPPGPPLTERENHYRLLVRPLLTSTLEVLDATAATYGIELRYPFFDKRLIEFCLSLPPDQKLHRGWSRYVMRQAMAQTLPEEIRWRPGKSDLAPSLDHGLRRFEGERLTQLAEQPPEALEPWVDQRELQALVRRYIGSTGSGSDGVFLWRVLSLADWLEDETVSTRAPAGFPGRGPPRQQMTSTLPHS